MSAGPTSHTAMCDAAGVNEDMSTTDRDTTILRDLAEQFAEAMADPKQDQKRALWREHNSFRRTRPMVLCLYWCASHELIEPLLECEDPFFRAQEAMLRRALLHDSLGDDFVIEPWLTVGATRVPHPDGGGMWGMTSPRIPSPEPDGAWTWDPVIKTPADFKRLHQPTHEIDEEATARSVAKLHDAVGDILEINVDRAPSGHSFAATLSNLRGLENLMWDMLDNPKWLHEMLAFLRDGVLNIYEQAEQQGHWTLGDHSRVPVPYAHGFEPPQPNGPSVNPNQLFAFFHAQEYAQVSPQMHDEFILQYQMPLLEKFGFVHYGCCEDLTHKIDILRKVPSLRRIAVVPWADVRKCAEQIGEDYIISWQPNPAEMGCCGFNPDRIRTIVHEAMDIMRGCHVDIVWKDVQTVQGEPDRLRRWVEIVRDVTEDY